MGVADQVRLRPHDGVAADGGIGADPCLRGVEERYALCHPVGIDAVARDGGELGELRARVHTQAVAVVIAMENGDSLVRALENLEHVGQVVLALGVVVGDFADMLLKLGAIEGVAAGVAFKERLGLLGRAILLLDDAGDGAGFVELDASVAKGLGRREGESGCRIGAAVYGLGELGHGVCLDERQVSVEHHDGAVFDAAGLDGHLYGVAGTQAFDLLNRLDGDGGVGICVLEKRAHFVCMASHDNDHAVAASGDRSVDDPVDHRFAKDLMRYLGVVGLHACALAGGEDDGGCVHASPGLFGMYCAAAFAAATGFDDTAGGGVNGVRMTHGIKSTAKMRVGHALWGLRMAAWGVLRAVTIAKAKVTRDAWSRRRSLLMRLFQSASRLGACDAGSLRATLRMWAYALAAAVLLMAGFASPVVARGADVAESTFNDPYTAWAGYASTAAAGAPVGAVPVMAPASDKVLWSADAGAPCAAALRQRGQATYLYLLDKTSLTQYDATSGKVCKQVPLPAQSLGSCMFADSALMVPLVDGRLAAYDEDLTSAWVSDKGVPLGVEGATWSSCSTPVYAEGCVFVAFSYRGNGCLETRVASFSSVDGSLLWQQELALPKGALLDGVATGEGALPAALYSQGRLLVSGANSVAYLLEAASGKLLDSAATASAGLASCASSASASTAGEGESLAVAASDGTVCLVEAADSSLRIENSVSLGCALSSCAPVCIDDAVYVGGSDGSVYRLAKDGTALSLRADAQIPVCSSAISELLPVAYGEKASAMTLGVYAQAEDGSLFYIEQANDSKASVQRIAGKEGTGDGPFDAAAAPLSHALSVNRDGSVFAVSRGELTVFAADESRTANTPVGGSNSLDTLGASLAGVTLPNGAGLGVGALIFIAAFGAYAVIRNKGGRRLSDEGLDVWRSREDGRRS